MDERLQEILDAVQKTAVEVGDAAGTLLDAAGQKASSLLSVSKLNIRIADLNAQVNGLLQEVGSMVYGTHTGNIADSDTLLEKLREIDGVNRQIEDAKAEILRLRKEVRICPLCGASAQKGDGFCRQCGTKL